MVRATTETRDAAASAKVRKAAMYLRMSTDHQKYSTENQEQAIREYAHRRNLEIVATYTDGGRSGLSLAGRDALKQLIDDVQSGGAPFGNILAYDVSRWGRFQDADESAYYEYICKRAGIHVSYCAEQFENDGSPIATIVKGVKRAMAGEFSRELSVKVFAGQCRLVELGFRQGGPAGYGVRRVLVDQGGQVKATLQRGEHKSLQTDRVILVPGPPEEVEVIQRIYQWFKTGLTDAAIAVRLTSEGIPRDEHRKWTVAAVRDILTNEKYMGSNIFNRRSFKLKKKVVHNSPEMWIRREGAFEGVVSEECFREAQAIRLERARRRTDEELLVGMRDLFKRKGSLSLNLINEAEDIPTASVYINRFGSLGNVFKLVGFEPARDLRFVEIRRQLRSMRPVVVEDAVQHMQALGGKVQRVQDSDLLVVNNELTVFIVLARCRTLATNARFWTIDIDVKVRPDITVAVRLEDDNVSALDYYLFPLMDFAPRRICIRERNPIEIEAYRFASLDYLYGMAAREPIWRAA